MPLFNGTGPRGMGPLTGRGRGNCSDSKKSLIVKTLSTIIIPTIGVVVNDIRKPEGITRKLYTFMKSHIAGKSKKRIEKIQDNQMLSEKNEKEQLTKNITG